MAYYGNCGTANPMIAKARGMMSHRGEVKVGETVYKAEYSPKGEIDSDFAAQGARMVTHVATNVRAAFKGAVPAQFIEAVALAAVNSNCPNFARALQAALRGTDKGKG